MNKPFEKVDFNTCAQRLDASCAKPTLDVDLLYKEKPFTLQLYVAPVGYVIVIYDRSTEEYKKAASIEDVHFYIREFEGHLFMLPHEYAAFDWANIVVPTTISYDDRMKLVACFKLFEKETNI